MRIKWEGAPKMRQNLKRLERQYPDAFAAALYQEGFKIMAESKRICPVATARLINTGFVAPPKIMRGSIAVQLGYGTDYALYVHENTSARNWTKAGSGPKFLERPVDAAKSNYRKRMARRTWMNLRAGITARAIPAEQPKSPRG